LATTASVYATLTRLIASGAYAGDRLPAERELCQVLGASRTTVRRVLAQLADAGVLARSPTGRIRIQGDSGPLQRIAFLAPAFASTGTQRWEAALRRRVAARDPAVHLAALRFTGWDDPLIGEAARGCVGMFLLAGAERPPARVLAELTRPGLAVASLESDLSAAGIPSLDLYPPTTVDVVLAALVAHGHRRIGWLNTQPACAIVRAKEAACRAWLAAQGLTGVFVSEPVVPFEDPAPAARSLMQRCLVAHPEVTVWLCSVVQCARGAIRAIHDRGWRAGHEVSVATIDGEQQEDLNVPSLACAAHVDPGLHLDPFLDWFLAGPERVWHGPRLRQPVAPEFHPGESLGRRRASK
jgi:hypothetical protein